MKKYNVVVTSTGEIVCHDCTHHEALLCMAELIKIDKRDGVFEKGFYSVKEAK